MRASVTIVSDASVPIAAEVLFQAGTEISLVAPFNVAQGADFTAKIAGCSNVTSFTETEKVAMTRQSTPAVVQEKTPKPKLDYEIPLELHIAPNPLQYQTTISYKVARPDKVYLTIYNSLGQEIVRLKNGLMESAGLYRVNHEFDQDQAGIYFASLQIGNKQITKRLLVIR